MKDTGHSSCASIDLNVGWRILYRISLIAAVLTLTACASRVPAPVEERGGYANAQAGVEYYTVKSGDTLYSIARAHNMDHRELIALTNIENADQIAVGRMLRLRPQSSAVVSANSVNSVETQPITLNQGIEQRTLGPAPTGEVTDGATTAGSNSAMLKREPKAGKEPYSEQALALAQGPALPRMPELPPPPAADKPIEDSRQEADVTDAKKQSWIWPASGAVLSHFGNKGNKGVDVSGKRGDPVNAAQDGKVIIASNALRGYGHMIIIKHAENLVSVYAHNSKLLVKEGERVSKGQKIAEMGSSDAEQVKLHFEIRIQGKPTDPMKYLPIR